MFPVKKINVGKNFKLREIFYLIILSINILKLEISGCDSCPDWVGVLFGGADAWSLGELRIPHCYFR
jgi:hypothetical protein